MRLLEYLILILFGPLISSLGLSIPVDAVKAIAPWIIPFGVLYGFRRLDKNIRPHLPKDVTLWKVSVWGLICGTIAGVIGGIIYGYSVTEGTFWVAFTRVVVASMNIGIAASVLLIIYIHALTLETSQEIGKALKRSWEPIILSLIVGTASAYILMNIGEVGAAIASIFKLGFLEIIGSGACESNKPYIEEGGGARCDIGNINLSVISVISAVFILCFMPFVGRTFRIPIWNWRGFGLYMSGAIIFLTMISLVQILPEHIIPERDVIEQNPVWMGVLTLPVLLILGWFVFTVLRIRRHK